MTEPKYIAIQTRQPTGSDPGAIEEGFYIVEGDVVQMTNRDGLKLSGKQNRRPIGARETAKEVAVKLLRAKVRSRPASPFNRPLGHRHYFNMGKI